MALADILQWLTKLILVTENRRTRVSQMKFYTNAPTISFQERVDDARYRVFSQSLSSPIVVQRSRTEKY